MVSLNKMNSLSTVVPEREAPASLPPAPSCSSWKPRQFDEKTAMTKMMKNSSKAIEEHIKRESSGAYATQQEVCDDIKKSAKSCSFTHSSYERQGKRSTMEDAHFFKETKQGCLAAVFDGHCGDKVAKYASQELQKRFFPELKKSNNVHATFEKLLDDIHNEVLKHKEWDHIGKYRCVSPTSLQII